MATRAGTIIGGLATGAASGASSWPRRIMRLSRYPDEERLLISGALRDIGSIGGTELVDSLEQALRVPSDLHLTYAGSLMRASDVIDRPTTFFTAAADTLVNHVLATSPTPAQGMARLLGTDFVGGVRLSIEERSMRLGKGMMNAVAELQQHGIDPYILFEPHMLDYTVEYLRSYIMRSGWAHGARSELRQIVQMDIALSSWLDLRHQLPLPGILGGPLLPGPDSVLYAGGRAYYVQLKAFRDLESLFFGRLVRRREFAFEASSTGGGLDLVEVITGVYGPSALKQSFTDALRTRQYGFRVPGPSIRAPVDGSLPTSLTGWYDLHHTSVFSLDDTYHVTMANELVSDAAQRVGTTKRRYKVDLMTDINRSVRTRERLVDIYGQRVLDVTTEAEQQRLTQTALEWYDTQLPYLQGDHNRFLARQDVVDDLGGVFDVRLVTVTQGIEQIPKVVGLTAP